MHLIADFQKKQRLDLVAVKCIYFILGKKEKFILILKGLVCKKMTFNLFNT